MRGKSRSVVTESETDVLGALLDGGTATVEELRARLGRGGRWLAHATVTTLLDRLRAKGLVERRKAPAGKAYLYSSGAKTAGVLRRQMGRWVARVFGGDPVAAAAALFGSSRPTAQEIERLSALVASLKPRAGRGEER